MVIYLSRPIAGIIFLIFILGNFAEAQIVVNSTAASGNGTLADAISQANSSSGSDSIIFNLPIPSTISLDASLIISSGNGDQTIINGDIDRDGDPDVTITTSQTMDGLIINAANCKVMNLHFMNFSGAANAAISISGVNATGNKIIGSFIGTNISGTAAGSANFRGIEIESSASGNFIGDGTNAGRNIISNNSFGIYISASQGNTVSGNIIGLDINGIAGLGNFGSGIEILGGSNNNKIGISGEVFNIISGNGNEGISISGSTGTIIVNNHIGTDLNGTSTSPGNGNQGIFTDATSSGTVIGDATAAGRNIIGNNSQGGIVLNSDNNIIKGNYVGVGLDGITDLGNTSSGIRIATGATGNLIGDGTNGGRNIIGGTTGHELQIAEGGNEVYGNYIGVGADGLTQVNASVNGIGIFVTAGSGTKIGDAIGGYGNVVSGNTNGIQIQSGGNFVLGNRVGTDYSGTAAVPNSGSGVFLSLNASGNIIGDGSAAGINLISGNAGHGIAFTGAGVSGNSVQGNYIGTQIDGLSSLGNNLNGVSIQVNANANSITQNTIAFNNGNGIEADGISSTTTNNNTFSQNSIFNNTNKGISVINGAQNNITAPTISSVTASVINGTGADGDIIEVFRDNVSTTPQGKEFVGQTAVSGSNWSLAGAFSSGTYTATATDASGNTSEFSLSLAITPFITTWKTDNPGSSLPDQITIPTTGTGYSYDIYWEEVGNPSNKGTEPAGQTGNYTITFPNSGTYQVEITGNFPRIFFAFGGDREKILSVEQWGDIAWTSMVQAFQGCVNLDINAQDAPDLSAVTDLTAMFYACSSLAAGLNNWDVSAVATMYQTFAFAPNFNGTIGAWNVGNVTTTFEMFYGASSFNQDLSNWNVSNLNIMTGMFRDAFSFNGNITTWNTSLVTDMQIVFLNASSFNQNIDGWDVSSVINMASMFQGASVFNQNLNSWTTTNVANTSFMFRDAVSFNGNISSWDVSKVTNMAGMFQGATSFNQNINSWNTSSVTNMNALFFLATSFNQSLNNWNTSAVTSMNAMFLGASSFNQDINFNVLSNTWNVGNVTDMTSMFESASSFNSSIDGWDVSSVVSMYRMFIFATAFNQDLNSWQTNSLTNTALMFAGATTFNGNIGNWDVSLVTDMSSMFDSAPTFNQDISGWITSNVTNMGAMFSQASSFNQDLSSWNVSKVTFMRGMFFAATNFNQDIGTWAVGNVTDMLSMFQLAISFNQNLSSWDVSKVVDFRWMFLDASSFNQSLGSWTLNADPFEMLNGSGLSTSNYDATLIGWESQAPSAAFILGAVGLTYCAGETARQRLINNYGWTITDAGKDCSLAFIVTNTNDSGEGSLRWCIDNANLVIGTQTIQFNIPNTDPNYTLNAGNERWTIEPVTALPVISESVILDATTQPGNGNFRIKLDGLDVITNGIEVSSTPTSIYGFYITNFSRGIYAINPGNGGLHIGAVNKGNVINSCTQGISTGTASNHVIKGNFIGTDETGMSAISNITGIGMTTASNVTIGGSLPGEGNVISGNTSNGVTFNSGGGHIIENNLIGVSSDESTTIPNGNGIDVNTGGNVTIRNNTIGGNTNSGIRLFFSSNNTIQGNNIGIASDGSPLPNNIGVLFALTLNADNTLIGGTSAGEANTIAFNLAEGVSIKNAVFDFNQVIGNSIFGNAGKGIDLGGVGNENKAAPVISSYDATSVTGTGAVGDAIHVYRDNSGYIPLQGQEYLGTTTVISDGSWTLSGLSIDPASDLINATATDASDNTSEFAFNFGEIAVFEGTDNLGPEIADGQLTVVDLGISFIGNDLDFQFAIENQSAAALNVSSVTAAGTEFAVLGAPAIVQPFTIGTFTLRLSGAVVGIFTGTVTINSDDEDESVFDFPVTGEISYAPPVITATFPQTNAIGVAANANIQITFTENIDGVTLTSSTFMVDGSQTGVISGSLTGGGTNTITFNPATDFRPGERIRVRLTTGIQSIFTIPLDSAFSFEFFAGSLSGPEIPDYFNENEGYLISNPEVPLSISAADVDSDGDVDVIAVSETSNQVFWYENDGNKYFTQHLVDGVAVLASSIKGADVDKDGDMDLLSTSISSNEITWYENDGLENFTEHLISTGPGAYDVFAIDMDLDGDNDVVAATAFDNKVSWYENDGSQNFTQHVIASAVNFPRTIHPADADQDGDIDIFVGSSSDNQLSWYENDGSLNFTQHFLPATIITVKKIFAADVNNDGELDLLSASYSGNKIAWHENDGNENFTEHIIKISGNRPETIYAADMDGDGDMDILEASSLDYNCSWHENDGAENFTEHVISSASTLDFLDLHPADIDNDGDLDIIWSSGTSSLVGGNLGWFENTTAPPLTQASLIIFTNVSGTQFDINWTNGDGGERIVLVKEDIPVDSNPLDGRTYAANSTFGAGTEIGTGNFVVYQGTGTSVTVTGITQGHVYHVRIYELNGSAGNENYLTITANGNPNNLIAGMELLSISPQPNDNYTPVNADIILTFNQPVNGVTASTTTFMVSGNLSGPFTGAITGGGTSSITFNPDRDFKAGEIIHVTLTNGIQSNTGSPLTPEYSFDFRVIANPGPETPDYFAADPAHDIKNTLADVSAIMATDLDQDGDIDILASYGTNTLAWYDNNGTQTFTERIISTTFSVGRTIDVADIDGDGDLDIAAPAEIDNSVLWYQNDGAENFLGRVIDGTLNTPYSAKITDLDSDGDIDIVVANFGTSETLWYQNDGNENFSKFIVGLDIGAMGVLDARPVDLDGDGDLDVVSAVSWDKYIVYENNGLESFIAHDVPVFFDDGRFMIAMDVADLDSDGDLDLIGAPHSGRPLLWLDNDGSEIFTENVINGAFDAGNILASDMDGDGDMDLLLTNNDLTWLENDGTQNFTLRIVSSATGASKAFPVDIDGDGDLDVVSGESGTQKITWYENRLNQTPAPEINVYLGSDNTGISVLDGQATAVDFGSSPQGTDIDLTFAIENIGNSDLSISTIIAAGTDFSILTPVPSVVSPATTQTFVARLSAISAGTFNSTLTINNNDADEAVFDFPVTGIITATPAPEINIFLGSDNTGTPVLDGQATAVDFGSSPQGTDIDLTFAIENIGNSDLSISTIIAAGTDFSILTSVPSVVSPGSTQTFVARLSAISAGTFNSTLTINNNDADEAVFDFPVTGIINVFCTVPPTANAGPDQIICESDVAILAGILGGSASAGLWTSLGDGTFDNPSLLAATYSPGTADIGYGFVTLTLTASDGAGSCPDATDTLTLTLQTGLVVNAGIDFSVCPGAAFDVSAAIAGVPAAISWTSDGSGIFTNPAIAVTQYTPSSADEAAGFITLTCTATSASCASQSDQVVITFNQPIQVQSQSNSVSIGSSVQFDLGLNAVFNPGDTINYSITQAPKKGAAQHSGSSITYTPNQGTVGNDSLQYQACNQCGLCDSDYVIVNILNVPPTIDPQVANTGAGETVTIEVSSTIFDLNDNIDLTTLTVTIQPNSGAFAYFDSNGNLIVDYTGIVFTGIDRLTIRVCDSSGECAEAVISIEVDGVSIIVFNAVSPNGDGIHDYLKILNIEFYPNNIVNIYNRWGDKVFEMNGYENKVFERRFNGDANVGNARELSDGTYFYSVDKGDSSKPLTGFLTLRR